MAVATRDQLTNPLLSPQTCAAVLFSTAAVWCVPFSGAVGLFKKAAQNHQIHPMYIVPYRVRSVRDG